MISRKWSYLITGASLSLFVVWLGLETPFFRILLREDSAQGYAEAGREPVTISIDGPAPPFETVTAVGDYFSMDELAGQPILITFWASWCEPCIESLHILDQIADDERVNDLVILTVNSGEDSTTARAFFEDLGIDLTILMDQNGDISGAFGQHYFPTTYFIDRGGVIRSRVYGPLTETRILSEMANLASYEPGTTSR